MFPGLQEAMARMSCLVDRQGRPPSRIATQGSKAEVEKAPQEEVDEDG